MKAMVFMRAAGFGTACSAAAITTGTERADAAPYLFESLHKIGEELAYDLAKPTIADNGSVAFLDIQDFVTDERIMVIPAFGDKTVLIDSDDPVRPSNLTGPGISDDGVYVAYVGREQGGTTDRIYRQEAGGSPAVLIAGPGSITDEHPNDPIGAASCRGNCKVTEQDAIIGGSGTVLFSTLSPTTLSFGNGGTLQTFATGGAIGLHDEFHQSGRGFKFVVLESGGEQQVIASLFSVSPNGVEWANTNTYQGGKYSEFRSPAINDLINTAIIAERDLGGEEILAFLGTAGSDPSVFSTYATTDGAFASFDDLSLGDGKDVVFLAKLDTPGSGKALYAGPDPVNDRIIGPGDKLFNKTVVSVDLAPADAVNESGQIAFAAHLANGTSRIVKATPFTGIFAQAKKLLMSTLNTNLSPMLWTETLVPDGTFDLSFNYDLLQPAGMLEVYFGGSLLGTFTSEFDGRALIESISPRSIFGGNVPERASLEFVVTGGPDVSLHLDDILMPGLLNGNFEDGYLRGWFTDPGGPGVLDRRDPDDPGPHEPARTGIVTLVRTQPPSVVPLPAGVWLLGGALAAMGFLQRRQG